MTAMSLLLSSLVFAQVSGAPGSAAPSLAPIIDSVKGAVVHLEVSIAPANRGELLKLMKQRGLNPEDLPHNMGSGSGFVIDPKGLIITNNHVVEEAVSIKVHLDDGRVLEGAVVGRDPLTDVALVKVAGKIDALPFVKLGDSSAIRVGDAVFAIGTPLGLAQSVSSGIISARDRQIGASRYDQFLQTDAAINPGNSGGPLFNLSGEVIGMNTAIYQAVGIGFAVPSNLIKAVVPQLEKSGTVTRGWLGVAMQEVSASLARAMEVPGRDGVLVTQVNDGSPAAKAGLQVEDVILAVDGEHVSAPAVLTRIIALKRPTSPVVLSVIRKGKPLDVKVQLGVRPDLEQVGDTRGKAKKEPGPHLGLAFEDVDPRLAERGLPKGGALITHVDPSTPGEASGLERGMIVVELNRKPVKSAADLDAALKGLKPGSAALVRVAVGGSAQNLLIGLEVP